MLVSWKYKFLFIHVPKSGGTTLTRTLAPFARKKDRLAYIGGATPVVRRALLAYAGDDSHIQKITGFNPHARFADIERDMPASEFEILFKFAFVRNPFSRTLTLYNHIKTVAEHPWHDTVKDLSLEACIPLFLQEGWHAQTPFVCRPPDDALAVDFLGAFECLDAHLSAVAEHLQLPQPLEIKRPKLVPAAASPNYRSLFGTQLNSFVAASKKEFDLLGYSTDIDAVNMPPHWAVG